MPEALPIEFIHHVSRMTRDLDLSIEFYRDVLGFQAIPRANFNFRGAWLFNYGLQIHLIESAEQLPPPPTEVGTRVDHIARRRASSTAIRWTSFTASAGSADESFDGFPEVSCETPGLSEAARLSPHSATTESSNRRRDSELCIKEPSCCCCHFTANGELNQRASRSR